MPTWIHNVFLAGADGSHFRASDLALDDRAGAMELRPPIDRRCGPVHGLGTPYCRSRNAARLHEVRIKTRLVLSEPDLSARDSFGGAVAQPRARATAQAGKRIALNAGRWSRFA